MSESKRSTSNTKGKRKDAPGSKKGRKSSKRQKKKQEEKHEEETKAETTAPPGIARAVHQAVDSQIERDEKKLREEAQPLLIPEFAEDLAVALVRDRMRGRYGSPVAGAAHAVKWMIATVVDQLEKDSLTKKRVIAFCVDGKILSTAAFIASLGPDPDPQYINRTVDKCCSSLMGTAMKRITNNTEVCVMCMDQLEIFVKDGNYVHLCPLKTRNIIDLVIWERFGKDLSSPGRITVNGDPVINF